MPGVITYMREGITTAAAVKVPCKAATTVNITLSGTQTIDGVSCAVNDRVLVKNQTNPVENGIYIVNTGTWQRSPDFDGTLDVKQGTFMYVSQGSTNTGFWYVTTADPIIPGTTSITIIRASSVLAGISAFMQDLLNDADAVTARNTLGASAGIWPIALGGTGQATAAAAFDAIKQAATDAATGVVELATNAEALGGIDTTRAVTSAGLASAQSQGQIGYMKFPGGLIVQWGTAVITLDVNGNGTTNFSTTFPTAFRAAVVCNGDPTVQGSAVFSINTTTSTTTTLAFSVRPNPGAVAVRVNYTALGI